MNTFFLIHQQIQDNNDYKLTKKEFLIEKLEKKVIELEDLLEDSRDNQNLVKYMKEELEDYKIKSDISMEMATYFSPF